MFVFYLGKYLENPSKRRHENIRFVKETIIMCGYFICFLFKLYTSHFQFSRVYPRVRILRTYISNNKVGHLVDIAWNERITTGLVDNKKLAYNKQLMFGSLLLFTSDKFEKILCATVLDSGMSLLSEGYVSM